MNFRSLGKTGFLVSEVGFGCWQLGGEGWGAFHQEDALAAVRRALDLGINLFDTAPVYGFGRSEELLAKVLRNDAGKVVVVSKAGLVWDERRRVVHDNRPESLARSLEASLKRLRMETLDVLLLYWPDPAVPLAASAQALESFRKAGKIRAWGLSNFAAADVLSLDSLVSGDWAGPVIEYPVNVLRSHAEEYRESARAGRELLEATGRRGWGYLAFDVLGRGLLAGGYDEATHFGKRDIRSRDVRYGRGEFERHLARVGELRALACAIGVPTAAVAIRAVLGIPGLTSCLVGMRNPRQVEECVSACGVTLPEGLLGWAAEQ